MPIGLPPPYPEIYEKLTTGALIPFLGAGVPLFARNPKDTPWFKKLQGKDVFTDLPNASELAEYFATRTALPDSEKGGLAQMAQYFEAVMGLGPFHERLRDIFSSQQPPTLLHRFLAEAPAPLLIVTTNYDDLMERAYQECGKPCDVVVHMTDQEKVLWWPHGDEEPREVPADELLIDLDQVSIVYKIHGAIDRRNDQLGQYVITEDDYVEFLTRMTRKRVIPTIFAEPFQKFPFLFLGYGLYDWNLRVILNRIQEFRGHPVGSWAIETLSKPVERKLWDARGINVYDGLTLDQFLRELKKQGVDELAGNGAAEDEGSGA
jgi:hypothetical protein